MGFTRQLGVRTQRSPQTGHAVLTLGKAITAPFVAWQYFVTRTAPVLDFRLQSKKSAFPAECKHGISSPSTLLEQHHIDSP